MTIMTERNQVRKLPVLSVTVYMMNDKQSLVYISASIASFFKRFPGILSIRSWHLGFDGISIPFLELTGARTEHTSIPFFKAMRSDLKRLFTLNTISINSISSGFKRACSRTVCLILSWSFLRNKFNRTKLTNVLNDLFSSKQSSTLMPTSEISISMAKRNSELLRTYRTSFINLLHRTIIA